MHQFDELVAYLTSEQLLDDANVVGQDIQNNPNFISFVDLKENSVNFHSNLLSVPGSYDLKLPDFGVLIPENEITPYEEKTEADESQKDLFQSSNRRRKVKKVKRKGKYCQVCDVKMPPWKIHCRYCRGKLVGKFYYYILLTFSVLTLSVMAFFMMS